MPPHPTANREASRFQQVSARRPVVPKQDCPVPSLSSAPPFRSARQAQSCIACATEKSVRSCFQPRRLLLAFAFFPCFLFHVSCSSHAWVALQELLHPRWVGRDAGKPPQQQKLRANCSDAGSAGLQAQETTCRTPLAGQAGQWQARAGQAAPCEGPRFRAQGSIAVMKCRDLQDAACRFTRA